ncbi:major facilitator superfamily transporter [Meredithblackwellia eburnea MCA 4105]
MKPEQQMNEHATQAGRENLAEVVPPHESYEGFRLWDPNATWTAAEEKKVRWIIDLRLLTMLCFMFIGLQLDRGNLSNALTDNFLANLKLSTNDYNNGTSIQLVCFLAAEFPFQMLIKRYGFNRILPGLMTCWGLVSTFQCFITNRWSFYLTRALIGTFEGGFIPGTILCCTYYYTSTELAIRLAVFWSTLNFARILSSLLAAGFLEMRGVAGWAGWRWLFMFEGLLTLFVALIAFLALPTSPSNTKTPFSPSGWFTPKQEVIAINRVLRDDPAKGLTALKEPLTWKDVKGGWCDKSMWGLYFLGLIAYIPASPVQGYLSLTLKTIGFSTFDSNMLSIPSAALQMVLMLGLAWSSDYFKERAFHCFFGEFWCLPLLIALQTLQGNQSWSRFTLTTMIAGYPYFHPLLSAWISENSFSIKKRAVTAATYNVIVQIGSVISSQIYRNDDKPRYHRGNKVLISICCGSLAVFLIQRFYLAYLNKQKLKVWNGMTEEERIVYQGDLTAREADGNKRVDFLFKY